MNEKQLKRGRSLKVKNIYYHWDWTILLLILFYALQATEVQVDVSAKRIPTRPEKFVFRSQGTAQILVDSSVQLEGDTQWQEFTLYFVVQKPTLLQETCIGFFPRTSSANSNQPHHASTHPKWQNQNQSGARAVSANLPRNRNDRKNSTKSSTRSYSSTASKSVSDVHQPSMDCQLMSSLPVMLTESG